MLTTWFVRHALRLGLDPSANDAGDLKAWRLALLRRTERLPSMQKSRWWCGSIQWSVFNVNADIHCVEQAGLALMSLSNARFIYGQLELSPKTHCTHLQLVLYFATPRRHMSLPSAWNPDGRSFFNPIPRSRLDINPNLHPQPCLVTPDDFPPTWFASIPPHSPTLNPRPHLQSQTTFDLPHTPDPPLPLPIFGPPPPPPPPPPPKPNQSEWITYNLRYASKKQTRLEGPFSWGTPPAGHTIPIKPFVTFPRV